jgi:hypothetical protein
LQRKSSNNLKNLEGFTLLFIKRKLIFGFLILTLLSACTFVFAMPGPAACLLVGTADLKTLPDGTLTDSTSEPEQLRFMQLAQEARTRIEKTFGATQAKPVLVFFKSATGFGAFKLNSYGSTQFLGSRVCAMLGPDGQNVDVVAHELMHVELHHRVGYLRRFLEIPAWFDEGLAMQVDLRSQYDLLPENAKNTAPNTVWIRQLDSQAAFNKGDDAALTRNYATAKSEVAAMMSKLGASTLFARFEQVKAGESFTKVFNVGH